MFVKSRIVLLLAGSIGSIAPTARGATDTESSTLCRSPQSFVANEGQWNDNERFRALGSQIAASFRDQSVAIRVVDGSDSVNARSQALWLSFENTECRSTVVGEDRITATYNFFHGRDRARWCSGVGAFESILYQGLYPGIDVRFRGPRNEWLGDGSSPFLEYDLVLQPGASLDEVVIRIEGEDIDVSVDPHGDLRLTTPIGEIVQPAPQTWQISPDGERLPVESRYRALGDGRIGFSLGKHDTGLVTVLDPVMEWVTYLGGTSEEVLHSIDARPNGIVITGFTASADFPATRGVFEEQYLGGLFDAYVAKYDASGEELEWTSIVAGQNASAEIGLGVLLAENGEVWVTGVVGPAGDGFPVTDGAILDEAPELGQGGDFPFLDVFLTGFSADGSDLVYSSLFGGEAEDNATDMVFAPGGGFYICGSTSSKSTFPVTPGAFQELPPGGENDPFLLHWIPDPELSASEQLVYSSFVGGTGRDTPSGSDHQKNPQLDLMPDGLPVIAASVDGFTIPAHLVERAFQANSGGGWDVLVAIVRPDRDLPREEQMAYATLLGGSNGEGPWTLSTDEEGGITVGGWCYSSDYPTTAGAIRARHGGSGDGFVTRLEPAREPADQLRYSTLLGGAKFDMISGAHYDTARKYVVSVGEANSEEFLVHGDALDDPPGFGPVFFAVLDASGATTGRDQLIYSSRMSGRNAYSMIGPLQLENDLFLIAGASPGFTNDAEVREPHTGGFDAYLAAIRMHFPLAAMSCEPTSGVAPLEVEFDATGSNAAGGPELDRLVWDFEGDELVSTVPLDSLEARHTYDSPGRYFPRLTVEDAEGNTRPANCRIDVAPDVNTSEGWTSGHVGAPTFEGGARFEDDGCIQLWGGGDPLRVFGSGDRLHFVHRSLAPSEAIEATHSESSETAGLAQVGLMLRDGLDVKATYVSVFLVGASSESSTLEIASRARSGGTSSFEEMGTEDLEAIRLRLEYSVGSVRVLRARGDDPWTLIDEIEIELGPEPLAGLFIAADEPGTDKTYRAATALFCDVSVTSGPSATRFMRGDVNADGGDPDIADPVFLLNHLFAGDSPPPCEKSGDTNDDNELNIADPVYLLNYLFAGGPPPASPFAECGVDDDPDESLTCESFPPCE